MNRNYLLALKLEFEWRMHNSPSEEIKEVLHHLIKELEKLLEKN